MVLKVIQIPCSTYYYAKEHRGHELDDSQVIQAIDEIRRQDPKYTRKYGYRRITESLRNEYGFKINHKCVLRIMREKNWLCQAYNWQKRQYNSYKGTVGVIAPNRLNRRFKTDRPYQKLVIDVSEFRYGNKSQSERVYLELVLDLYNGEILAFTISDHPTVEFALKPLKEALEHLPTLGHRTTPH
ncbi:IS3 family transposase [Levilactobacillus namurensis]|nr:IS3 family transposase [Levilactobacillus namurensis]MDT7019871.1 IS3 family transposase [Levilactobacillus namurensis]